MAGNMRERAAQTMINETMTMLFEQGLDAMPRAAGPCAAGSGDACRR